MDTFSIVKPTRVSWEAFKDFRLQALWDEPQAFSSSYNVEKNAPGKFWQDRLKNSKEGKRSWMVFAKYGEKLVGMVGAYQTPDDSKNKEANMVAMFVAKDARRKGVAKLLTTSLFEELQNAQLQKVKTCVNIDQLAALHLYKALGFAKVSEHSLLFGDGKTHTVYLMEKLLT
ncbi:MAG: GNAT family N-acetyltransferase [Candidatus Levybacteria bacterium]|nr:GNAT family N-acetyltransferase [Candidatus Levybacteria bacterium]